MAWRLDESVEHGLIDNTVRGITTGKIWLKGRDEPIILSLNGDCWRDLAGSVLKFRNPSPQMNLSTEDLDTEQTGLIGDITASRKAKVPEIDDDQMEIYERLGKDVPFAWRNLLYIEWFSEINGRVLIETVGYDLKISESHWKMDEDEEEAQKLANLSAMRDFLCQIIGRDTSENEEQELPEPHGELNEYQWEERLKESDRLSDAYQEVLEKYMEDYDCEQKEAFVMGWDTLLSAMADQDESGLDEDLDLTHPELGIHKDMWTYTEFNEEDEDPDAAHYRSHPLQIQAQEIALRASHLLGRQSKNDEIAELLTASLVQVSAKLAGALHSFGSGYELESGFILAILKRCLSFLNDALGACAELLAKEKKPNTITTLESLRSDIFNIRNGILEMRQKLKQS